MDIPRPSTAPCRSGPEQWTEVGVLVRDMLHSVASAAATEVVQARPHTACAGARALALSSEDACGTAAFFGEDEEESDGGDFDETASDEVESPRLWRRQITADKGADGQPTTTQSSTELPSENGSATLEMHSPSISQLPGEWRLLVGGLWGTSQGVESTPKAALLGTKTTSLAEGVQSIAKTVSSDARTKSFAESSSGRPLNQSASQAARRAVQPAQLPKDCVFIGASVQSRRGGGSKAGRPGLLSPCAAAMRSHNSWVHYLPVAGPRSAQSSTSVHSVNAQQQNGLACEVKTAEVIKEEAPQLVQSEALTSPQQSSSEVLVTMEPPQSLLSQKGPNDVEPIPCAPCNRPKHRKGAKYHVLPGGSRPRGSSVKAPLKEQQPRLMLEFRTEPRVVPASRRPAREETRGDAMRFRPSSRHWDVERQVLAIP